MALSTIVRRRRIIVGAIHDLRLDGKSVGATQGTVTFRQAKTFYDVDDIAQISGTILKSLTDDKRFVDATLAEGSLENIHRAWDDAGGVVHSVSDAAKPFGKNVTEVLPKGMGTEGRRIYALGETNGSVYRMDDLGQMIRIKAANVASFPVSFGLDAAFDTPESMAFANGKMYALISDGVTGTPNTILATLDLNTGKATKVGAASVKVTVETLAKAIAFDGTTMFVAGDTVDKLHSLNLTTAAATAVDSAAPANYGVDGLSGFVISDMAWTGNDLVAVGVSGGKGYLITLNRTTGKGTRVGAVENFGLTGTDVGTNPQGVVWFDNSLWLIDAKGFYQLDIQTSIATRRGDVSKYRLNNPDNTEIERHLQIIAPGDNGRIRLYDLPNVVSMATGEHAVDKAGKIMVPVSWELLNDPENEPDLQVQTDADFGQFGTIFDVPRGHSILTSRNFV